MALLRCSAAAGLVRQGSVIACGGAACCKHGIAAQCRVRGLWACRGVAGSAWWRSFNQARAALLRWQSRPLVPCKGRRLSLWWQCGCAGPAAVFARPRECAKTGAVRNASRTAGDLLGNPPAVAFGYRCARCTRCSLSLQFTAGLRPGSPTASAALDVRCKFDLRLAPRARAALDNVPVRARVIMLATFAIMCETVSASWRRRGQAVSALRGRTRPLSIALRRAPAADHGVVVRLQGCIG